LLLTFLINNAFLKEVRPIDNIIANCDFFLKACFIPFFLIPFYNLKANELQPGLTALTYIFWINCICIVCGVIFQIKAFQTYPFSHRFGYKGLFDRSTYTSYIFIFMIMYYYYNWVIKKQSLTFNYLLLVVLISFLVGTKRIVFFNCLLLLFHFFKSRLYKSRIVLFSCLAIGLCFLVFNKAILNLMNHLFSIDLWVNIHKDRGFLSALTSLRSDLLIEYIQEHIQQKWSFLNYFLGGGLFHLTRPEIALIDIYLFFGVVGILCYFYIFKNFVINFKSSNKILWFYLIIIMLLAMSSSGIVFSAYFALLIIIFSSYFRFEN
jgi:hypothetical protein